MRTRTRFRDMPLLRHGYLGTLVALQVALLLEVAPPLAQALRRGFAFGAFPEGALGFLQNAAAIATIGGGALALAFPLLALLRHRRRGPLRFGGLPRSAVALAVTGGIVFAAGALLNVALPLVAPDARMATALTARPLRYAGLALMAAGVLWAEMLRRGVGVPRVIAAPRDAAERIEVTHPRELATHVA